MILLIVFVVCTLLLGLSLIGDAWPWIGRARTALIFIDLVILGLWSEGHKF